MICHAPSPEPNQLLLVEQSSRVMRCCPTMQLTCWRGWRGSWAACHATGYWAAARCSTPHDSGLRLVGSLASPRQAVTRTSSASMATPVVRSHTASSLEIQLTSLTHIYLFVNLLHDWDPGWLSHCMIESLVDCPTAWLRHWLIVALLDCMIDLCVDRLNAWWNVWLVSWLID